MKIEREKKIMCVCVCERERERIRIMHLNRNVWTDKIVCDFSSLHVLSAHVYIFLSLYQDMEITVIGQRNCLVKGEADSI